MSSSPDFAAVSNFERAWEAARTAGAIGFGIAGAGPSVFAWAVSDEAALRVERDVRDAFAKEGLSTEAWRGPIGRGGARVETVA